jgi:FixJ family two-component response regulator
LESLIKSLGFVAFAFKSAENFLRSPRVDDSSCLITPGMSGFDLQDHLIAQGSPIPIIFITAFPEQTIRSRAQAGGALALLEKPFKGRTVIELVRQAVRRDLTEDWLQSAAWSVRARGDPRPALF